MIESILLTASRFDRRITLFSCYRSCRPAVHAALVTILVCLLGPNSLQADTITDDFNSGISSALWSYTVQPASNDPWTVSAPVGDGRLVISKPADPGDPSETLMSGVASNFVLVGDFMVSVDFDLVNFPHPNMGYNQAILAVGPEDQNYVFAALKFSEGIIGSDTAYYEAFKCWGGAPPGFYTPPGPDSTSSGTFAIQRIGDTLNALVDRGSGFSSLGVSYTGHPGPLTVRLYGVQLVRPATQERSYSELDIRFDNFSVTADQIVPEPGTMLLLGTGIAAALGFVRKRRGG